MSFEGVLVSLGDEELFKRAWAVDSFRHIQHEVVPGVLEWLPTVLGFSVGSQQRAAARALEHAPYRRAAVGQLIAERATRRGWPSSCASRLQGRCFYLSPHHDDTVEFVADGRVDDIAMAFLGSDLPSLPCFTRDWSALHRRLHSCQAALLQIQHQWLGQDR